MIFNDNNFSIVEIAVYPFHDHFIFIIFIWWQEQDYAALNKTLALTQQSLLNKDVYLHI